MKTFVVIILCLILFAYIYLIWPYVIYSRQTRKVKQMCSKNRVCYLEDAFPTNEIPNIPIVLFEYYHKEHLTPEILKRMDFMAEQYDIPYKVVNRRHGIGLFPPDTYQPKIKVSKYATRWR